MDLNRLRDFVEHTWETEVMPALLEFLHLPTARRITAVVAHLLHDAATVSVDVSAD